MHNNTVNEPTKTMIRIYFEVTPCRKSLDANIRLVHVYRTDTPEDLTTAPDMLIVHEKSENVKAKRSYFTSMKVKPGKLDLILLKDLQKLGMTQAKAVNVLLACTSNMAQDFCNGTYGDMVYKFNADQNERGDNQVQVTVDIKGRKTIPAGYVTACA